jgi:hypothetical protein
MYKWASLFPGDDLKELEQIIVDIEGINKRKKSKGLLS